MTALPFPLTQPTTADEAEAWLVESFKHHDTKAQSAHNKLQMPVAESEDPAAAIAADTLIEDLKAEAAYHFGEMLRYTEALDKIRALKAEG